MDEESFDPEDFRDLIDEPDDICMERETDMNDLKTNFLDHDWGGWRYIIISKQDDTSPEETILETHEAYQGIGDPEGSRSVSWTAEAVTVPVVKRYYEEILDMLEDGIVFTEEELYDWNEKYSSDDSDNDNSDTDS